MNGISVRPLNLFRKSLDSDPTFYLVLSHIYAPTWLFNSQWKECFSKLFFLTNHIGLHGNDKSQKSFSAGDLEIEIEIPERALN